MLDSVGLSEKGTDPDHLVNGRGRVFCINSKNHVRAAGPSRRGTFREGDTVRNLGTVLLTLTSCTCHPRPVP